MVVLLPKTGKEGCIIERNGLYLCLNPLPPLLFFVNSGKRTNRCAIRIKQFLVKKDIPYVVAEIGGFEPEILKPC